MGLSGVLEAIIGLAFIYLLVSMFCSGVNELVAQELGRRGKFLREGLVNLVADRWFYLRVINHPLVASMYRDLPGKPRTPSYIPPGNFVNAMIDVVLLKASQLDPDFVPHLAQPRTFGDVHAAALKCKAFGYTVGDAILPLLEASEGDLARARANLGAWYESGMQRVSGWYKKDARRTLLAIGIAVAVLFNVDTLQIATQLAHSSALRSALADAAARVAATGRVEGVDAKPGDGAAAVSAEDTRKLAATLAELEGAGLPIGFSCLSPASLDRRDGLVAVLENCWEQTRQEAGGNWLIKILGWLITGLAVSLGAPFWFDLLNRFVDLRGAGRRPAPAQPVEGT
jgi:hypothetical protein